jgi:uncharacterized membrane protein YbhN (UPF0104 family)
MKKRLKEILRYLVAGLLAASIVVFFVKNRSILPLLYDLKLTYCALLLVPVLLLYLIGSANLFVLLKTRHPDLIWFRWLRFHLVKRFMNMHLPQSGNVYEAMKVKEKFDIDLFGYATSFGAVNWFNAFFNCLISLLILVFSSGISPQKNIYLIGGLLLFLSVLIIVPLLLDHMFFHVGRISFSGAFTRYINGAHTLIRSIREDIVDFRILPKLVFWNSMFFAVSIVTLFLGFRTLNINMELNGLISFGVLNTMVGMVSILPGNIGIIEYSYGFLGSAFQLSITSGILLSLVFRLVTYLVFIIVYIFFSFESLLREKMN